MYSAVEELTKRIYQRAATVGVRSTQVSWEYLPGADRDRWRAIAEMLLTTDSWDLWELKKVVQIMSAQIEKLEAAVRRNGDVIDSGITLIQGLAAELRAAKADPQKIEELASTIEAKASALAQAVADNTPVPG